MQLIINDTNELSDLDIRILAAVVGQPGVTDKVADAIEKTAPAAKKTAPAKKAAVRKPEPELDPEPEGAEDEVEEADDLIGGDVPTMADAVALATKKVNEGEAPAVKAALASVGAKRVSELKDDTIADFVAALS